MSLSAIYHGRGQVSAQDYLCYERATKQIGQRYFLLPEPGTALPARPGGRRCEQPGALGGGEQRVHMVEVGKCVIVTQPGQVHRARAGLLPTLGLQELLFTQLGDKPQGDSNQTPANSQSLSRHLQIMTNQVRL